MARPKKTDSFKDIITSKLKSNDVEKAVPSKKVEKIKPQIASKKVEAVVEVDESISDLRIISKSYRHSSIEFRTYYAIPIDRQITKSTDTGSRVIVADYPMFYKIYFVEYIDVGKPHFPNGGIKVYNATFDQTQYFYYDAVALHPTKKDKYRVRDIE